jgi:hypothetical protein
MVQDPAELQTRLGSNLRARAGPGRAARILQIPRSARRQTISVSAAPESIGRLGVIMEKYSGRSMLLIAVLLVFICRVCAPASHAAGSDSLDVFPASPSQASWRSFLGKVRSKRYKGPDGPVFSQLLNFFDAAELREFPNSMALTGITPDQFVDEQIKRANSALAFIREHQTRNLWLVIGRLATQSFDDELIFNSCELAIRLSPKRFNALALKVEKLHPGKKWIVERIRERWLVQWKGH